ncbi:DUF2955 domain-containing protein [Ramlibacter sp. PS3R-8]|uniref:DUF2955 domain-containing protein n=1 Tax=Ramlibacter sp. PS3R-8 TaxID=3133437 RepID=UPI0030A5FCD9
MHAADKAVLRLAVGVGLSAFISYASALPLPFVGCIVTVVLLAKPGPPLPFVKGMLAAMIIAAVLVAGVLMVPVLEHYPLAGVLLTGVLLHAIFSAGKRTANAFTTILVIACTAIPVTALQNQAMATVLSVHMGVGLAAGVVVSGLMHALFPDPPAPVKAAPPLAPWHPMQATLVVMPVFVLALINPASYVPALVKSVLLGQQAGGATARSAGRELVGSTVAGAAMAALVWFGLTLRPNLWMLVLWLTAAALWAGTRMFGIRPTSWPPSFWANALVTMFIVLGPAIEDSAAGKDVPSAAATRVAVLLGVSLYAWAAVSAFTWMQGRVPRKAPRPAYRPRGPGRLP